MTPGWSKRGARPGAAAAAGRSTTVSWGVLAYTSPRGHALIDRELSLPAAWTEDPGRCSAAGIPEQTEFKTKPELVVQSNGSTAAERCGGGSPRLRRLGRTRACATGWLPARCHYVLATRNDDLLGCPDGHRVRAKVTPSALRAPPSTAHDLPAHAAADLQQHGACPRSCSNRRQSTRRTSSRKSRHVAAADLRVVAEAPDGRLSRPRRRRRDPTQLARPERSVDRASRGSPSRQGARPRGRAGGLPHPEPVG